MLYLVICHTYLISPFEYHTYPRRAHPIFSIVNNAQLPGGGRRRRQFPPERWGGTSRRPRRRRILPPPPPCAMVVVIVVPVFLPAAGRGGRCILPPPPPHAIIFVPVFLPAAGQHCASMSTSHPTTATATRDLCHCNRPRPCPRCLLTSRVHVASSRRHRLARL